MSSSYIFDIESGVRTTDLLAGTDASPDSHFCKNVFDELCSRVSILSDAPYRFPQRHRRKHLRSISQIQSVCKEYSAATESWKSFFKTSDYSKDRTWLYNVLQDAGSNYESPENFKQLLIGAITTNQPSDFDVELLCNKLEDMAEESIAGQRAQGYLEEGALSFLRERNESYTYLLGEVSRLERELDI
nr:uncharacterized protein I203_05177 [Kwoniella mangroviensis CBS 8507]OCF65502.1 hypothetical protein I203_05177 [Kwoniella mangroviensis CBS 8507]